MQSPQDTRRLRHRAILRLIETHWVRSQAELQELLDEQGIEANQATLSRDLRELGVVKSAAGYELPAARVSAHPANALATTVKQWLLEAIPAQNQVVLKTPAGGAQALALAIDRSVLPEAIGTLAGDDTVLVICADSKKANKLAATLEGMR